MDALSLSHASRPVMQLATGTHRGASSMNAVPVPSSKRVLHALVLPESALPLELLVISPSGIYSVDAIRAPGKVKVRDDALWLDGVDMLAECAAASSKAAELGRFMHHAVTPVLSFTAARLPAPVIHYRHVVICSADMLSDYVSSGPQCLERSWVQVFGARAAALAAWPGPPPPRIARRPTSAVARHPAPTRTRSTSSHPRHGVGRRLMGTVAGTVICIAGAWAVPAAARMLKSGVDPHVEATAHQPVVDGVVPAAPAPSIDANEAATAPVATDPPADPAATAQGSPSIDAPELLPTLDFSCPSAGAGWTATPVGSDVAQDPVGYHLWYRASDGSWQYWGHFMAGSQTLAGLPALEPTEEIDVRIDRNFHADALGAPTMLMFTAPEDDC